MVECGDSAFLLDPRLRLGAAFRAAPARDAQGSAADLGDHPYKTSRPRLRDGANFDVRPRLSRLPGVDRRRRTKSPALDAARRIAAAHPGVSSRLLRSAGTATVNPKLNNLAAPLACSRYDFVFTKDSNITLDPGTMAAFVQNFTRGVGLVVGVPVAVRARNFAGRIEAFSINGHARVLLAASALGLGFGVGKAMLFRRSDLASAGGIEAISVPLSEDTALSIALARQGLKTVFSHLTIAQETGARSFAQIYERQLRWSVIRRKNERFTFPWSRWRARFQRPSRARSRRRLFPVLPGSASS